MSSGISPENERFLELSLAAGKYQSREEALDRALDLLRRREEILARVDEGAAQIRAGDYLEFDAADREGFVAEIVRRADQRNA